MNNCQGFGYWMCLLSFLGVHCRIGLIYAELHEYTFDIESMQCNIDKPKSKSRSQEILGIVQGF